MLRHIVIKAVFVLLSFAGTDADPNEAASSMLAEPGYAKWGKLAMTETAKTYRDASIIDYKYEGRQAMAAGEAEERFTLWLRQGGKEFGVRVLIRVETSRDTLKDLKIVELSANR